MKKLLWIPILFVATILFFNMFTFVVRQDEVAIVKNLGVIEKVICNENDIDQVIESHGLKESLKGIKVTSNKGLNFKLPFINKVTKYTAKYLTYLSNETEINTKDSRQLLIQMYAQFRIKDPAQFAIALKSKSQANTKLDDLVYPTIVNAANALEFDKFFDDAIITEMLNQKKEELNTSLMRDFGLYVIDMGINRKNFPGKNRTSIEQKMSKRIEKESEKLVAEGDAEYQKRKAKTDKEKQIIIASAVEEAAKIKASADAEALEIFRTINKDVDFYRFIKRMELYKDLKDTTIFLDDDSDFTKFLNNPGAN